MLPKKLAFVDIETSGCSLKKDRIIEIGIVVVEDNEVITTYESLINPNCFVPDYILGFTGINPNNLEKAPSFEDISSDIAELLEDCVFVAHNSRFDYGFVKTELKRVGLNFAPKELCTVKLSRRLFPQYAKHNLDSIIQRFNITCNARHRALGDAYATYEFFKHTLNLFSLEEVSKAINLLIKSPSVPLAISPDFIKDLPETFGVYIFRGAKGVPLYVGKSNNIKKRVMSHFSESHSNSIELKIAQQLEDIETIVTYGELGALLKESDLIKSLKPIYNRKLRESRSLLFLKRITDEHGYYGFKIEDSYAGDSDDLIGVFKSKKEINKHLTFLSDEYNLCKKLLGLESFSGSCFGHRLGKCKGACIQEEKPVFYNVRFIEAFSKTKLKKWPFTSPIMVTESDGESLESHILDNWCYLGCVKQEDYEFMTEKKDIKFDYDSYKIISSFLQKKENLKKIEPCKI